MRRRIESRHWRIAQRVQETRERQVREYGDPRALRAR